MLAKNQMKLLEAGFKITRSRARSSSTTHHLIRSSPYERMLLCLAEILATLQNI